MPFPSGEMLSLSASCGSAKHLEGICLQEKKGFFGLAFQRFRSVVTVALQKAHGQAKLLAF